MRFVHLADLHLGRTLAEFPLIDLQREVLMQAVEYAAQNRADAVLIAGDVYDHSMPSVQAVNLLNELLMALSRQHIPVLLISGNHDNGARLSFLSGILGQNGIHICGNDDIGQKPVTLCDQYGPVDFHMMPFFRPGAIRAQLPDETILTYDDAVAAALRHMPIDLTRRNVLIAHQFVWAGGVTPLRSESEMIFAGGTEMVSSAHFDLFDYVALGHLHQPQKVGRDQVRYAGAPLKYALGEVGMRSFTVVDMAQKGDVRVTQVPFAPSINLRAVRGKLSDILTAPASDHDGDFLEVTLTDEEPVYDAMQRLRVRYPRTVSVHRERDMMRPSGDGAFSVPHGERHDLFAAFNHFAQEITGQPLTDEEQADIRLALAQAQSEEAQS